MTQSLIPFKKPLNCIYLSDKLQLSSPTKIEEHFSYFVLTILLWSVIRMLQFDFVFNLISSTFKSARTVITLAVKRTAEGKCKKSAITESLRNESRVAGPPRRVSEIVVWEVSKSVKIGRSG